ncbi:TolB family protein [Flavobacterium sp.]|uniref:TolB family protein n=1 Tax=Flavobacterium sp. TaxID=239 RepID=UPI0039E68E1A
MKNFLKTSCYVIVFAVAGVLFQISCSNSDDTNATNSPQALPQATNKLIYVKWDTSGQSIWTCDSDGSNQTQIPITLPAGIQFNTSNGDANPRLSQDGQKVFFVVYTATTNAIYSCDIDGSNIQEIVAPDNANYSLGNTN